MLIDRQTERQRQKQRLTERRRDRDTERQTDRERWGRNGEINRGGGGGETASERHSGLGWVEGGGGNRSNKITAGTSDRLPISFPVHADFNR